MSYSREYARAYYVKNRDKILVATKSYARSHPEIRAKIAKNQRFKRQHTQEWKTKNSWRSMMARCYDPKHKNYLRYGGAGVRVCERWHRWLNFKADMGIAPAGTTIDRLDSAQGYWPENCRWATRVEQANNRRNNRHVLCNGMRLTVCQAADLLGIRRNALLSWTKRHPEYTEDVKHLYYVPAGKRRWLRLKQ